MPAEPVKLTVHPPVSRLDEPVRFAAVGLEPGTEVVMRVRTSDGECRAWESWGRFLADARGEVNPAATAPSEGTYEGVSPLGLLWSMRPAEQPYEAFFARRRPIPLRMTLTLEV